MSERRSSAITAYRFWHQGGLSLGQLCDITAGMHNAITQQRLRVLEFWEKHGLATALEYSGKSRRTLYDRKHATQTHGASGQGPPSQRLSA